MQLKSSKQVIGTLISDINLDISDIEHRLFEWIDMALDIMDITKHYVLQRDIIEIENGKGKLPCNMDNLHSIWGKSVCGGLQYINITGSPLVAERHDLYEMIGVLGSIDGNYLNTSFKKGKVLVIHKSPPKDCDGYPMIPVSAKLDEALMYYIIYRLALKGYKHPIITFELAYQQWNNLYVGAANDVEWFTLPELEEFSRLWGTIQLDSITDNLYIN
jgi:hypothetical protein